VTKIIQIMASGALGGGADHLLSLSLALRSEGFESEIWIGEGPSRDILEKQGLKVCDLELMHSRWDVGAVWRLGRRIAGSNSPLVHLHGTRAALYGAAALGLLGKGAPKALYTAHGLSYRKEGWGPLKGIFVLAEALVGAMMQGVISVSQSDLDDLIARGFVLRERAHFIPNAVDAQRFKPADKKASRRRLGIPEDRFCVGTVSRLVPQKALRDLIVALAPHRKVDLIVVGEGPQRQELESLAKHVGLEVYFLGARQDVPQILPAFDVFCLSSRWEGQPIALLEAMACALPCVVTGTEGVREVVTASGCGFLVPIGEPSLLGQAIVKLMNNTSEGIRQGRQARVWAETQNTTRLAQKVAMAYRSVLGA
jgi:glycosyltransferase involved in cell wall biosynthesis